ncbi:hypothetical protein E6H23_00240 [Candidatus Bathyarchaeota archaeon]|nr:MAG: hypothetical protein E6H23_00240 [Candidatus Bathyarchaeota archaeon]
MTFEEAKGLLKLSREARWSYPLPTAEGTQIRPRELLASSKMLLGKAGIDPGPDDKFEIDWLEQQIRR